MNFKIRKFFEQLLIFNLESEGYEVLSEGKIIRAYKESTNAELIIALVTRNLSNVKTTETSVVKAATEVVKKLKSETSVLGENSNCCIAFGIAKYGLDEFELAIIPTEIIEKKSVCGGVYAITNLGYFYDYQKFKADNKEEMILRKSWKKI
ncbi:hypothetical protein [Parvimonas sp. G1425]|uniref:hypothetical protein n=1 Tax=Parvimonas sp. G1425 TaxID=3387694 RepID=UPI0039E428D0